MLTQEQTRNIIKKLKDEYGFTYTFIAEKLGISSGHLTHYLSGTKNLRRDKIYRLEQLINFIEKGVRVYEWVTL